MSTERPTTTTSLRRDNLRSALGALENLRSVLEQGDPDLYEAFGYTLAPLTCSIMRHLSDLEGCTRIDLWDAMVWWEIGPPDIGQPEEQTLSWLRHEARARTKEWRYD